MHVPRFTEAGLSRFLTDMLSTFDGKIRDALSRTTANHSVLLHSPAGKIYEVKVDDAGILTTTLVRE